MKSPSAAPRFTNEIQRALIRPGHRLTVSEVAAMEELDAAFRAWADGKQGAILWDTDQRLAEAVAAVLHIELVGADDVAP